MAVVVRIPPAQPLTSPGVHARRSRGWEGDADSDVDRRGPDVTSAARLAHPRSGSSRPLRSAPLCPFDRKEDVVRTEHCNPDNADMCPMGATLALEFEMTRRRYEAGYVDEHTYLNALHDYQAHVDDCRVWDFEGIPIRRS
jgi:hypothetical protein